MYGLVIKTFIAFWLAVGVIILFSAFETRRYALHPELTDALDDSLAAHGRAILHAYETGVCSSALKWMNTSEQSVHLASIEGEIAIAGAPKPITPGARPITPGSKSIAPRGEPDHPRRNGDCPANGGNRPPSGFWSLCCVVACQ